MLVSVAVLLVVLVSVTLLRYCSIQGRHQNATDEHTVAGLNSPRTRNSSARGRLAASPRTVPGPWLAQLSSCWIVLQCIRDRRNRTVHALHALYGPIVRLAPHEVSLADPACVRQIYITGDFDKSDFYSNFSLFGGTENAFSILSADLHSTRRRIVQSSYSKSTINRRANMIAICDCISQAMLKCAGEPDGRGRSSAPVNVLDLFKNLTMDILTGFQFGEPASSHFLSQPEKAKVIFDQYHTQDDLWWIHPYFPTLARFLCPESLSRAISATSSWLLSSLRLSSSCALPGVVRQLRDSGLSELETASEIANHVFLGYQTTPVVLSYLCWQLSIHDSLQEKLRQEILQAAKSHDYSSQDYYSKPSSDAPKVAMALVPHISVLDKLPLLSAVIDETLRLYTPMPASESRLVPASGYLYTPSSSSYGDKSSSYFLPGGTVISIQPWTLHRDPIVFSDPESFNPERWLINDPEVLRLMNRSLIPFGAGATLCSGMNLALTEIRITVAAILTNYYLFPSNKTTLKDMEMTDRYSTRPRSNFCYINFEKFSPN
ncbi:cytochrome P450 [Lipomyces oligophaga]|uniref:cytochrome P450 n=1 Tax=Lipomyces oligophaga TaxID=45792 RepID=UPI0034CF0586